MKKSIAILIFTVFFLNQAGYYLMYAMTREKEDDAMVTYLFKTLKEKECEIINYSDNIERVYWQKEGTDFLLDGEEWDVVHTKLINGKIYLYCITDIHEEELLTDISLSFGVDHRNGIDFELAFTDEYVGDEPTEPLSEIISKEKLAIVNNSLTITRKDVIIPPPRLTAA